MSVPWWLKWDYFQYRDLEEMQDQLNRSASSSYSTDRQQDKEIEKLRKRVSELELQLLALEKYLAEQGILPPLPEESDPEPTSGPISFPSRTEEPISCPVCGRRQRGNRDCCFSCGVKFQYEDE